ncbi:hypothetical protein RJ639_001744 [Escallonia herrerae]|uniref:Heat shock protein 70 n=1 Tax=Escallonia herrerae TaxID=1293975 RepID=A0AA88X8T2_9ASTE|nr:hypothetical protein RJ639_001744 [Escallonia herrerae]
MVVGVVVVVVVVVAGIGRDCDVRNFEGWWHGGGVGGNVDGALGVVAEKVVGIDLGTTNSTMGPMEGGKPVITTNAEGQRMTSFVVAWTKNEDRMVGQIAKRQAVVNPENTFFSMKRFISRKMSEVDEESKQVSYTVVCDSPTSAPSSPPRAVDKNNSLVIVDHWFCHNYFKTP